MQKIFYFIVEATFWILLVLSKFLLFLLLMFILNSLIELDVYVYIFFALAGLIYGIYFAEKIREKHGCSNYWSKIYNTSDIDGNKKSDEEKNL
ncbi:hypothetical protein [Flavobacterium sp. FlaQc-28]|uniref:hypothetical protein n=1 Tax=Flavobacterium sp. FlaQc-28 TaxID=3374178 RepID=UPI003756EBBF